MNAQDLKNSILQLAIQGKLVEQRAEEGTARELLEQIKLEKDQLIKDKKIKKSKPLPEITEDEIPFEIPESWEWVRVNDIFNVKSAMRIHQTDWQSSGIPFFRGRELVQLIKTGNVDFDIYISKELYEKNKEKGGVPSKNDILVTAVGTIGKSYIVKGTKAFYYKDAYILCFENIANIYPEYIKYCLDSPYMQNEIHRDSMATTVAQLTIIKAKEMLVPFPPLEEQHRIVAKIEEILPYIDKYDKAYTKLETFNKKFPEDMKKSILQMAMQGKLVEQRPEEGSADKLYEQIVAEKAQFIKDGKIKKEKPLPEITEDEIPFEIPSSWKWVRLGTIVSVYGGKRIPAGTRLSENDTGHKYIRVADMKDETVSLDDIKYITDEIYEKIKQYFITSDDIYITVAGTIGRVGVVPRELNNANLTENADKLVFRRLDKMYLCRMLNSEVVQHQIREATTQVGQPKLAIARIQKLIVPLPPLEEQKRIVAKIEELLPYCDQLIK